MARFDGTRVSLSDRRLSGAVACMVVIKIFGATVAQQASFSADASDWAPKPGKGVEAKEIDLADDWGERRRREDARNRFGGEGIFLR